MGLLDGLLEQIAGNVDVANLAEKVGISHEQVEQAMAALGQAHVAPGNTVDLAAASTGLSADTLGQLVAQIGGEGSLGRFAEMLGEGGSGGMLGQIGGLVAGFTGSKKS